MGEVEQFTFTEVKIMINIYFLDMKKVYSSSELARACNTLPVSPYFRKMFNFLKEKNALIPTRRYGQIQLYMINRDKLVPIIDTQESIATAFKYIEQRHIVLETD